jgi:non-specific serine/threonine protein kinase
MYHFQGKHAAAAESARAAFEVGRQAGDPWAVSVSLFLQSLTAFELGDHKLARVRALEARDAADRGCGPVEHGGPLMILGNLALVQGEHDRAQQLFDESIEVHRRAGDSWGLSILLSIAAGLCVVRQDFSRARLYGLEALSLSETLEDPRGLAWGLEVCAGLLAADGQAEEAARLWGASDQLLERGGGMLLPTIGWIRTRYLDDVRTSLGEAVFGRVRSEGRDIPPDRAIALARDHANRFA